MRKLILTVTVALLTSGVSVFAINNINNNANEIIVVVVNDDFKEVALADLPEAVSNAILKDYSTATVVTSYVNKSNQYKIDLMVDETEVSVYADKEGNWLKETDIIKIKEEGSVSDEK